MLLCVAPTIVSPFNGLLINLCPTILHLSKFFHQPSAPQSMTENGGLYRDYGELPYPIWEIKESFSF
jgi:hypothetical protein